MLELWGSSRRVLVFKGSRRTVLEIKESRRMVLEWGLMLLVTGTSVSGFTGGAVGSDAEASDVGLGSTVKPPKGLSLLLLLPLPEGDQNDRYGVKSIKYDADVVVR